MHDLFEELKRRRVIGTVVAYAAAVFVVLQVADLTFEALGLPDWAYRFTVILSIVGVPVTAVSAWLFDLRNGEIQRTADSEGGATRRASPLVAAAVAAATVVVAGGVTWLLRSGSSRSAAIDTDIIAVAPFRVSSSDVSLSYLREGAVDLLAAKLTGEPRVVDPRTLLAAWRERAGSLESDLPEGDVVKLAAGLGAGRVLFGSIVGSPSRLTLTASLRDVQEDRVIAETTIDGTADSLTAMIDGLVGQLLGAQAGTSVESVTSTSIEAVRAYLGGRADYRRGNFSRAADRYRHAVELDSTFATAALGFLDANGMRLTTADATSFRRLAWAHRARLSSDDRLYLRAVIGRDYPAEQTERAQIEFLTDVVERLPDRAEAWYQYGDHLFHFGHIAGMPDHLRQAEGAFRRAMELDPGFINGALHLSWLYQVMDDPRWREVEVVQADAELAVLMRNGSISSVTDPAFRDEVPELLGPLVEEAAWNDLLLMPYFVIAQLRMDGADLEALAERATLRSVSSAPDGPSLAFALQGRWNWLANLGRWAEALELAESMASSASDGRWEANRLILEAAHLWNAPVPEAARAAAASRLTRWWSQNMDAPAALTSDEVRAACMVALHAVQVGETGAAEGVADALRPTEPGRSPLTGAADLSRRQSCALVVDARLAESVGAGTDALEVLSRWLDPGPPGPLMRLVGNLEAARLWLAQGEFERAASHASRASLGPYSLFYLRPLMEVEAAAREALGETEVARALRAELDHIAAVSEKTANDD